MKRGWIKKSVVPLVLVGLAVQLCSCGTLMYPERKGQIGGKIDPTVAILDGIGLLLFIIPGVIAFAVDFSNGTIYLPPNESSSSEDEFGAGQIVTITPEAEVLTEQVIEAALRKQLGSSVDISAPGVQVVRLDSLQSARRNIYVR